MRFHVIDAEQRSDEWRRARAGRLTGSRAADMLATLKGAKGEAAARRDLRVQLVVERLTGEPQEDGYHNAIMQRGIDKEPAARAAYEAATGLLAWESGFVAHDTLLAGCSLDGHVDDFRGIVELKCPKSATHFSYIRGGGLPSAHRAQVLHNLWITGAEWCDFVSFDDRLPPNLQLFRVRVPRDEAAIREYEAAALAFLDEVDQEHKAALSLGAVAV